MRKTLSRHKKDILVVIGLVIVFAVIRMYQRDLFYDPFLDYFEYDYLYKDFPEFDGFLLCLNYMFRYGLNSLVSLIILYVLFKNRSYIKLAVIIYMLALIVLLVLFALTVNFTTFENYQFLFYIRRFIIQPLLVLLLIPAFYFQKKHIRR